MKLFSFEVINNNSVSAFIFSKDDLREPYFFSAAL